MKWVDENKLQKIYDTMIGYAIWKKTYWPQWKCAINV
jgi:hypothetical protein